MEGQPTRVDAIGQLVFGVVFILVGFALLMLYMNDVINWPWAVGGGVLGFFGVCLLSAAKETFDAVRRV